MFISFVIALGLSAEAQKVNAKDDLAAFQGQWKVVWAERNGVKIERESTVLHTIRGDRWFIGEIEACIITLDPTCNPKLIDFVSLLPESKGTRVEGIYKFDGEAMIWCWEGTNGIPSRPLEFRTKTGSNRLIYCFRRIGMAMPEVSGR